MILDAAWADALIILLEMSGDATLIEKLYPHRAGIHDTEEEACREAQDTDVSKAARRVTYPAS